MRHLKLEHVNYSITLILQTRKLSLRELKQIAQAHQLIYGILKSFMGHWISFLLHMSSCLLALSQWANSF